MHEFVEVKGIGYAVEEGGICFRGSFGAVRGKGGISIGASACQSVMNWASSVRLMLFYSNYAKLRVILQLPSCINVCVVSLCCRIIDNINVHRFL